MDENTGRIKINWKHRIGSFFILLILCLLSVILCCYAENVSDKDVPTILLEVNSLTMVQDQDKPELTVDVSFDRGDMSTVLDEKTGYTVAQLLSELKEGKDYTIKCDADTKTEGSYPVTIKVDDTLLKKEQNDWYGKVRILTKEGMLSVKNKYGEWKGDKFIGIDSGKYLTSQFVTYKKKLYYLGADGTKVTGWQNIANSIYYFDKEGVATTGWYKDTDGSRYLFKKSGAAVIGWYEKGKDHYYFDAKGKMVTGTIKLLTMECVFGKDGKLVSTKNTIDPNKPMIALTFDDGPGKDTARLLDALEKYDAHATFFMLGNNIPKYPEQVKRMTAIGCELGNHSKDHALLTDLTEKEIEVEVTSTDEALKKVTGKISTVMRPPYGGVDKKVKETIQKPLIFWSIDTLDWKTKSKTKTVKNVMKNAGDGDIILLHDIHDFSVDAAIELIPKLQAKGYQLVTVSEMAEVKGITLNNGEKYFSLEKGK